MNTSNKIFLFFYVPLSKRVKIARNTLKIYIRATLESYFFKKYLENLVQAFKL